MPENPILHTSVSAALLMIAREILPELDWPSTDALLARLQAGRTQAYTMASRLREVLAELYGKPGRPPQSDHPEDKLMPVARATLDYLMRHPGACSAHQERCHYSDGFRCFIVGLVEPGQLAEGLSLDELSQACNVPRGTLKDWLGGPPRKPAPPRQNELVVSLRCAGRKPWPSNPAVRKISKIPGVLPGVRGYCPGYGRQEPASAEGHHAF